MVVFDVTRMWRNAVAAEADVRIGFSSSDLRKGQPLKSYITEGWVELERLREWENLKLFCNKCKILPLYLNAHLFALFKLFTVEVLFMFSLFVNLVAFSH